MCPSASEADSISSTHLSPVVVPSWFVYRKRSKASQQFRHLRAAAAGKSQVDGQRNCLGNSTLKGYFFGSLDNSSAVSSDEDDNEKSGGQKREY
jgi:hypothetical protein